MTPEFRPEQLYLTGECILIVGWMGEWMNVLVNGSITEDMDIKYLSTDK